MNREYSGNKGLRYIWLTGRISSPRITNLAQTSILKHNFVECFAFNVIMHNLLCQNFPGYVLI